MDSFMPLDEAPATGPRAIYRGTALNSGGVARTEFRSSLWPRERTCACRSARDASRRRERDAVDLAGGSG